MTFRNLRDIYFSNRYEYIVYDEINRILKCFLKWRPIQIPSFIGAFHNML